MTKPAWVCAALVALVIVGCGGLQPVEPGQALREAGASLAKLKTVHATLTFTKGIVSFQGYALVSANASVRLPGESDTVYKVRQEDVQISLEVIITGGRVFLHPPFSGYTELKGEDGAAVPDIAKLFVLGVGMRTHTGVARRMFGALAERGINISMINTSEVRVSVVVDKSRGEEALACLKETFKL